MIAAVGAAIFLAAAEPPAGLACLSKRYAGNVEKDLVLGWGLRIRAGVFLPWNDDEDPGDYVTLRRRGLSTIYDEPYVRGPLSPPKWPLPATVRGLDLWRNPPQSSTVEAMLRATYGETRSEVEAQLGRVRFFSLRWPFHRRAAPALERVAERLRLAIAENPSLAKYVERIGGTWTWRSMYRSRAISTHAFGIAIDLNPQYGSYWRWARWREVPRWRNTLPQEIVDAFEAEGFIWGGRWRRFDTMHFEYRPELLDRDCTDAKRGAVSFGTFGGKP